MKRLMVCCSVALFALAGCSKHSISNDPAFARKVVDAVYSGSLATIRDSLSPKFGLDDAWARQMSETVKPEFGAITEVKLNTFGEKTETTKEIIWTVTTERSTFLMQLIYDQDDKLLSIQFNY
ncbi:MAG: hypothetical protein NTU88_13730 [Armatimonadetes bacterium]|nr:hypothetical protein [Armatimonadota bacterium]